MHLRGHADWTQVRSEVAFLGRHIEGRVGLIYSDIAHGVGGDGPLGSDGRL